MYIRLQQPFYFFSPVRATGSIIFSFAAGYGFKRVGALKFKHYIKYL